MEKRPEKEPDVQVVKWEFLSYIHRKFYEEVPDDFRMVKDIGSARESVVVPGELRKEPVKVGYHVPPDIQTLPAFLNRFSEFYSPAQHPGATKLIAAAASHHRLMWIHPFLDGNGRVARFFTEAYCHRIPVLGCGPWSVSRGLARRSADYKASLADADNPRRNGFDGRGNFSNEALVGSCRFFLDVCLDQVEYMGGMLQLQGLLI